MMRDAHREEMYDMGLSEPEHLVPVSTRGRMGMVLAEEGPGTADEEGGFIQGLSKGMEVGRLAGCSVTCGGVRRQ
jgi:hypothetical protein